MYGLILAGGFGKRLRPLTNSVPKPLVKVNNKPILEYEIELFKKNGINNIILAVCYLKEKIIDYFGSGRRFGVKIYYSIEEEPLGTAGAIKNAEGILKNTKYFIVMNGDTITNIPVIDLIKFLKSNKDLLGCLALVRMKCPFGIIKEKDGIVISFKEKPQLNVWINAGIYAFRREILDYLPEKGDLEKEVFPILAEEKKLGCVKFENCIWISINTHKDLEEAEKIVRSIKI